MWRGGNGAASGEGPGEKSVGGCRCMQTATVLAYATVLTAAVDGSGILGRPSDRLRGEMADGIPEQKSAATLVDRMRCIKSIPIYQNK